MHDRFIALRECRPFVVKDALRLLIHRLGNLTYSSHAQNRKVWNGSPAYERRDIRDDVRSQPSPKMCLRQSRAIETARKRSSSLHRPSAYCSSFNASPYKFFELDTSESNEYPRPPCPINSSAVRPIQSTMFTSAVDCPKSAATASRSCGKTIS